MSGYDLNARDKTCPACDGLIPADAVICTRCGLNLKTGSRVREAERDPTDAERKAKLLKKARASGDIETAERLGARPKGVLCPACGYDMTGLSGRPCPECGHERSISADRQARRQKQIVNYWRNSWLVGGIGLGAGTAVTLGVGMGLIGWSMTKCLAHLTMCEVALFIGYAVVGLFIGYEEDLRGLAVRLVGVAAVWSGLWLVVSMIPVLPLYSVVIIGVITAVTLAAPLHILTDRDWDDSFWIATAAWVLKLVGWAALTMAVAL